MNYNYINIVNNIRINYLSIVNSLNFFRKKLTRKKYISKTRLRARVPYGFEKSICSVTVVASGGHMTSQQQQAEGIHTRRWYSPQRTALFTSGFFSVLHDNPRDPHYRRQWTSGFFRYLLRYSQFFFFHIYIHITFNILTKIKQIVQIEQLQFSN